MGVLPEKDGDIFCVNTLIQEDMAAFLNHNNTNDNMPLANTKWLARLGGV